MTSSVHHLVSDLAARLDLIERRLVEDYEAYASASTSVITEMSNSGRTSVENKNMTLTQDGNIVACRLNLSQRLATVNSTFSKSLIYPTASEIGDRVAFVSSVLLPSYISSDVAYEPDRLIESEVTAQRYAIIKRRLHTEGQRELEQLKLNMKSLTESSFAKDSTGAVIADVLAYNGPSSSPASGAETIPQGIDARDAMNGSGCGDIRDWVTRAANNNRRAQDLHLRLAKAKARYESLVNYSNKQMCVWDLQIEELERRARRQAAQRR